jgi:hypothetical protein
VKRRDARAVAKEIAMKLAALAFALAAGAVAAADPPGPPCPRAGTAGFFEAGQVEVVDGTIEKILVRNQGMRGRGGVHLLLKTAKESVEVQLGPSWFIDNQEAKLKQGDSVSVRGSRTAVSRQPALIAIDVKRGGETLRLREEDGTPLWSAWRGQPGPGRNCPRAGI